MKKIFTNFFFIILVLSMSNAAFSQILVVPNPSTYSTLQSAFAAMNAGMHGNSAIVVHIQSNTVETGTASLNWIASSVLIQPDNPSLTITGNFNAAVIALNGANNVTINGNNFLKIVNSNTGTNANGIELINGASNNTISNIEIEGPGANGSTAGGRGINIGASASGTGGNNSNLIAGCTTNGFRRGIQTFGTPGLFFNTSTTVRGCKVKNFTSIGIFAGSETQSNLIESNELFYNNVVLNDGAGPGTRCISIQGSGSQIIRKNRIHDITGFVQGGFFGIVSLPVAFTTPLVTPPTKVEIYNNMVALDFVNDGAPFVYGIYIASNSKNYTSQVYFNSIKIGNYSTVQSLTIGLFVVQNGLQGPDTSRIYNNVSLNSRTGGTGSTHAGQSLNPEPNVSIEADYNVAHADDVSLGWDYWYEEYLYSGENGMHMLHDTTCERDIEQNTVFIRPDFFSGNDLHLNPHVGTNMDAVLDGSPGYIRTIPGLPTTDIDGDSRVITGTNLFTLRGCDELLIPNEKKCWTINFKLQEAVCYPNMVSIVIRDATAPYVIWGSAFYKVRNCIANNISEVKLYTGDGILFNGNSKYLEIRTKHSIRTQSTNPVSFINSTGTYNFTASQAMAYGSNTEGPAPYKFYNGDVNQDDVIDGTDGAGVDNAAFNFITGCAVSADVNDDGIVDGTDASIVDNNAFNFVTAVLLPGTSPRGIPKSEIEKQNITFKKQLQLGHSVVSNY